MISKFLLEDLLFDQDKCEIIKNNAKITINLSKTGVFSAKIGKNNKEISIHDYELDNFTRKINKAIR